MSIKNVTNETNSTKYSISEIDKTVVGIEISLSIITVTLNLLNMILISISIRKKKTYSNILFLLISFTDFIVGIISIPGDVYLTYSGWTWTYSIIVCVLYKTFDYANTNFSLMLLLVITIHRWLQLKDPFKQKEEMNRRRWMLIASLLLFNYAVCFALWCNYFYKDENKDICYLKKSETLIFVYNACIVIVAFVLIIFINVLIIREFIIKKSKKMVRHSKKEDNAIYCILAITANLIICWIMNIFTWPIYKTCKSCLPYRFYTVTYLLNYSFAATSPIILLVFNQNYRSILFRKLNISETRTQSKLTTSTKKSLKTTNGHSTKF